MLYCCNVHCLYEDHWVFMNKVLNAMLWCRCHNGVCQIGEADMDVNASDEEKAEGISDGQQEAAPLEKDTVKVRRTFHHHHHPQTWTCNPDLFRVCEMQCSEHLTSVFQLLNSFHFSILLFSLWCLFFFFCRMRSQTKKREKRRKRLQLRVEGWDFYFCMLCIHVCMYACICLPKH